jgi:hypothetical protein
MGVVRRGLLEDPWNMREALVMSDTLKGGKMRNSGRSLEYAAGGSLVVRAIRSWVVRCGRLLRGLVRRADLT